MQDKARKVGSSGFDFRRQSIPFGKGVSSRKFSTKLIPTRSDFSRQTISNADVFIKSASGMSVLANLLENAAITARNSLQSLSEMIQTSTESDKGDLSRGTQGKSPSENDLSAFQDSFIRDVVSTAGVDDLDNEDVKQLFLNAIQNLVKKGTIENAISSKPKLSPQNNKAVPEIDFIDLVTDKRGLIDKFSTRIVFTIPYRDIEDFDVKAIRVFRAKKKTPESARPTRIRLTRIGMDELRNREIRTRNKNSGKDDIYHQIRLDENDVDNVLSDTTVVDGVTGLRSGLSATSGSAAFAKKDEERSSRSSDDKNFIALSSFLDIRDLGEIDASVVNDLKSIRNIQIQNPNLNLLVTTEDILGQGALDRDAVDKLGPAQLKNIRRNVALETDVIANKIAPTYKELSIVPIARLKNRVVGEGEGSLVEFTYVDSTVEIGGTYTYYVTTLDDEITESTRSRIVKITVENNIPPRPPKVLIAKESGPHVTLSMLAHSDDFVEKFEIYRKDTSTTVSTKEMPMISVIDGKDGFTVDQEQRKPIGNGYVQVGESLNSMFGGSSFRDKTVVEGKKYIYRVYSVNIFGNKSQEPKEATVFLNERSGRITDLRKPTVLAEVDQTTKNIRITINSDDNRAIAFFLARKNLTTSETSFTIPTQPSHVKMGIPRGEGRRVFDDTVLRSKDNAWNGYFTNVGTQIVFLDKTTRIDNTYQYRVHAVDRFGNMSSYEITPPLFISRRPIVSRPLNIIAISSDGVVRLSWDDGNLDVDPLDRIGDREVYQNNRVNTLFQVERKKVGTERWEQFPLTEDDFVEDRISFTGEAAPTFRPPFLESDSEYFYRVSTFQTGGFISNFSDIVKINTYVPVLQPANFRVKSCDAKTEPFFVALNWDTADESGTVDRWSIERAVINNFAGSMLNLTTTDDIEKLTFTKVTDVFRESSRSRARVLDGIDRATEMTSGQMTDGETTLEELEEKKRSQSDRLRVDETLSGQHHYIDRDVQMGNTYFYRITALGLNRGNVSVPVTRGIRLSDPAFDRKVNVTLTQSERDRLSVVAEKMTLRSPARLVTVRDHRQQLNRVTQPGAVRSSTSLAKAAAAPFRKLAKGF